MHAPRGEVKLRNHRAAASHGARRGAIDLGRDRMDNAALEHLPAFITSLAIGLLMGLERERNPAARAGLRTFALVALFGTLVAMLAERTGETWLLAVGLASVGAFIIAAYLQAPAPAGDPGTTTEAALLVCYCLGAAVWFGYPTLAIILAVVATLLLYLKPELASFSQNLKRSELLSILQFAVLTFVVLPILPDTDYGPYGAFNPRHIWMMVVLIAGVSLAGYIALKLLGRRWGAPLLGMLGGLVSSTATTLIYARHGRSHPDFMPLAVLVILLANVVVLARLAVLTAVVAPGLLPDLLPILGGGLGLGFAATAYRWRKSGKVADLPVPEIQNPTEIRAALTFGGVYAAVLFLSALLLDYFGSGGMYAVALLAGLTDVDSITLSSLHLFAQHKLEIVQVTTAIGLAVIANLAFKIGLVFSAGGVALARQCAWGLLAVGVGIGAAIALL
jgi:uncharacterized membrane protein (DUF4010 family)